MVSDLHSSARHAKAMLFFNGTNSRWTASFKRFLHSSVMNEVFSRGRWLLILLLMQSGSSFVLNFYSALVKEHIVLTLFLTMLVGAGGNAGAQSAMKTIKDISSGETVCWRKTLWHQMQVSLWLGLIMAMVAWVRVYAFYGGILNACAISISCSIIVITSIIIGAGLPFLMIYCGQDPVHSGAAVQVLMDLWGVVVSCIVCSIILGATKHQVNGEFKMVS